MIADWNPVPVSKAEGDGYNPNRDADGKFASGPGRAGGSRYKPMTSRRFSRSPSPKTKPKQGRHVGLAAWDHFTSDDRSTLEDYSELSFDLNTYIATGNPIAHGGGPMLPPEKQEALRQRVKASLDKELAGMDAVMSKSELEPGDYWRGIRSSMKDRMVRQGALKEGAVFEYKSFMSTSSDRNVAELFSDDSDDEGAILKVSVPKGVSGVYLGHEDAMYPDQKEGILNRGHKFRVVKQGKTKDSKGRVLDYFELEVVIAS